MQRLQHSVGLVPATSISSFVRSLTGRAGAVLAMTAVALSAALTAMPAQAQSLASEPAQTQSLALAQPPAQIQDTDVAQATALINAIRDRLDACGDEGMLGDASLQKVALAPNPGLSRPAVVANAQLEAIAARHAQAMAEQNFFDHVDPSGKTVGARATEGGYRWRVVGENLAAGQGTIAEAMRGWLLSSSHCKNLIDGRFTEFGLAKARSSHPMDPYGVYWVLVMGKPQAVQLASR